jgi:phenylacetate-CoA ligase
LNRETLFIEILDDNNKPLEFGKIGKIVVTSFFNKAMSFIRYETGDIGSVIVNENNEHILNYLEGRKDDLIYLPSGKIAAGMTFYNFTKSIMTSNPIIKELKAFQIKINTFEIHYTSGRELSMHEEENLRNKLYDFLEPDLKIVFLRFERLERLKSGKLKQFTSLIK